MLYDPVTTTRADVISIIACAEDYGHGNDVLLAWCRDLLGSRLLDEEIVQYVNGDELSQEDRDVITERLQRFRETFMR